MTGLTSRMTRLVFLLVGLTVAGSLWAQSQSMRNQQIAERLAPIGQACLAGEACAATVTQTAAGQGAFSAEATYDQHCAMCHDTGMAGAPTRAETEHWVARLDEIGFSSIVQNAINGINAMPPMGMCTTCTEDDMETLVVYLMGDAAQQIEE